MKKLILFPLLLLSLFVLQSCEESRSIVTDVSERDANEIIVFLASKNIAASKVPAKSSGPGGASSGTAYSIMVGSKQMTDAMAILNQNGLPRRKATDLLTLFQKQGLMSSDKEETIRYQAGLAESIASIIALIDGVIDAKVQIAFPPATTSDDAPKEKTTASVYVKHQGILDDPNSHLITNIKRIVSASVNNLDINDVTVISDRSRFTDITLDDKNEAFSGRSSELVTTWGVTMSKSSLVTFRLLFSFLAFIAFFFACSTAWLLWKIYPLLRKLGITHLFKIDPFQQELQLPTPSEETAETEI